MPGHATCWELGQAGCASTCILFYPRKEEIDKHLIAALTRGAKLAAPQAQASESHRIEYLVPAQGAGQGTRRSLRRDSRRRSRQEQVFVFLY